MAVIHFTDKICQEMDKGRLTGAVFVDLQKASDTVSHNSLIQKFPGYRITNMEIEWLKDYLFNRHQTVVFERHYSKYDVYKV